MPNVPGLRSCYDKVGRLIYFGRMLDKIRLHAAGQLPLAYHDYLGDAQFFTLDGRCCRFLGVSHSEIKRRALAGETDEAVLKWAHAHGTPRTDEECHVWNRFIAKLGWRDERSHVLPQRIGKAVSPANRSKPSSTTSNSTKAGPRRRPGLGKNLSRIKRPFQLSAVSVCFRLSASREKDTAH